MDRRKFISIASIATITGIAGCSGDPEQESGDGSADQSGDESGDESSEQSTDDSSEQDSSYQVRISYDGEWSGSIGGDGSTRSVDGSGTETFEIEGEPLIVSANAQKRDEGSSELTVGILQDGEAIARETTSAEFGVAQVTSEDDISSEEEEGGESESGSTYEVRIETNVGWQGSISSGGSSRSIQGSGSETITIDGSPDIISANAQKTGDGSDELTIQIIEDGEVVEETSTTAEFGVAQVSYSNF
jgi:hypothetical protein